MAADEINKSEQIADISLKREVCQAALAPDPAVPVRCGLL
jgi:hypothetical protein